MNFVKPRVIFFDNSCFCKHKIKFDMFWVKFEFRKYVSSLFKLLVEFYFCIHNWLRECWGSGRMKAVGVGADLKEIGGLLALHILHLRCTP